MTFDLLEEFRLQAHLAFDWLEAIVEDVTPEQALWQPPGRANTIAVNYAHIVRNIDEDFNQRLFRVPRLNEGQWLGRTGLIAGVEDWDQPHIDWPALREYGKAMTSFLYETMDALTYVKELFSTVHRSHCSSLPNSLSLTRLPNLG